ncbi:MAG TPA: 6-bladed beta-propeller [Candidatus Baltobacteraceae bacterium]|jgi:DNA-binding beta-propeller fold protein YncE|nr:6-bladed beta-propeller [Candidatus Baltobacteraceae bacterium]
MKIKKHIVRKVGLFALFLLAGLPSLVTPLRADNPPTYLFQWGSYGGGNGQFEYLGGIAVDSSNNVYVVDEDNSRVEKFDRNGNYLTKWGSEGTGNAQFDVPDWIAVDGGNNVYVVDTDNYRIEKFDRNGNYLTKWGSEGSGNGQFEYLGGIAVDNSNNVYVADTDNYRIEKFDRNGNYLTKWGIQGTGNGQFEAPDGIAVDSSNNVYVVDSGNARVEKFDTDGNYLTQWGSEGASNGQFEGPGWIAVDSSNNVYVVDSGNARVEKFDSDGNYLTQWGSQGTAGGQFKSPDGIALDGSGNVIYVADLGNTRVQVFANSVTQLPPYITSQPASQSVVAGVTVSLSVTTVGAEPMTYQWTSNDVALPDATNSALTLTNISRADTASYALLVTNSLGNAASSNFVLTVEPALVTTLPATGVDAVGAVLNASVSVGEDTIAWFNWGADTSYGNSTAMTIVPGASGTTNFSATLNGLTTNVYHYQIVASNNSGVVYGNDQSFVAANKTPAAATLNLIDGSDGPTLTGSVNPNGLDTTVYFQWGHNPGSLSNRTTITNIGSEPNPVIISAAITGLAPASEYHYQVLASNSLGLAYGTVVNFYSAPFVAIPFENWDSVASSADGSVLVAVANEFNYASPIGPILISTNSGASWSIATGAPTNGLWETVACSADGSKMIAAGGGADSAIFPIYTSSDMGATWLSNNAPVINWQSVASSADGARRVAVAELNEVIYTSTNSGAVRTQATNAPRVSWFSVALSADGTKLAAVANGSTNIYTSPDFGATWITNNVPPGPEGVIQRGWSSIASSADGSKLIAAVGGNGNSGFIFLSTNSGAAWKVTATNIEGGLAARPWIRVASSANGETLAAVSDSAGLFSGLLTSTNSGATWTTNAVPFLDWNAVALSADGGKLVATVGYPSTGPIYVSQTTPAPVLSLSASDNVISWTVPSMGFTLQQSSDLLNWTDVTNEAVLNFTNLENQVALPAPIENSFFRLKH